MKRAILNMADTGALESTAHMLEQVGYTVSIPDRRLIANLRQIGLDNVWTPTELTDRFGYPEPRVKDLAGLGDVHWCDLFVDTKAHVNYGKLVAKWPNLKGKVLWCCLNGGDPARRNDGLPWVDPPCPVLTNNQWYRSISRSYVCYPPYRRNADRKRAGIDGNPICLIHNVRRWGYGHLVDVLHSLGVEFYGAGDDTPEGMLPYARAMEKLSSALCMVYAKTGDTVGYAMVEAMASFVPFICTQFYIDECRLHDLLEPGVTCLTFDPKEPVDSLLSIFDRMKDPVENARIGVGGWTRYLKLAWNKDRYGDLSSFESFMEKNYA